MPAHSQCQERPSSQKPIAGAAVIASVEAVPSQANPSARRAAGITRAPSALPPESSADQTTPCARPSRAKSHQLATTE